MVKIALVILGVFILPFFVYKFTLNSIRSLKKFDELDQWEKANKILRDQRLHSKVNEIQKKEGLKPRVY